MPCWEICCQCLQVPLWQQRAGLGREGSLVIWDYHVICIQARNWDHIEEMQVRARQLWAQEIFAAYILLPCDAIPLTVLHGGVQARDLHRDLLFPANGGWAYLFLQRCSTLVWDLDTLLPFPTSFRDYTRHTLQNDRLTLAPQWQR